MLNKNIDDIIKFLESKPGYKKEGKKRLRDIMIKHGYEVTKTECAIALREFNSKPAMNKDFKRLFFDIETSPNLGIFWSTGHKINIRPEQILAERKVLCISYKWEGEDKVHNLTWDGITDAHMLEEFSKIIEEADEVIAHNGDRFDIKWLRTRCLMHDIPFSTYVKTLDTLSKVKTMFNFQSNKLDYIARVLGVGGKISTGGLELWVKVMFGDEEALDKMVEYCNNDVVILEDVYHRIQNYIKPNTHVGVKQGKEPHTCPTCGSEEVELVKNVVTASGAIRRKMKCACGVDFMLSNTNYRKMLK